MKILTSSLFSIEYYALTFLAMNIYMLRHKHFSLNHTSQQINLSYSMSCFKWIYAHQFPLSLLHSIITIFFILIALPASYCDDNGQYLASNHSFNCGRLKDIRYPFWEYGRHPFCGRQGFGIKCEDDKDPLIEIDKQIFRVLHINQSNSIMTIVRMDFQEDGCLEKFIDTTLNEILFLPLPNVWNLTLFYGCPFLVSREVPNNFNCTIDGKESGAFYVNESYLQRVPPPSLNACRFSVAVFQMALEQLWIEAATLQDALIRVGYYPDDLMNRSACQESGGICGSDWPSSLQFVCLCLDQPHPLACPNHGMAPAPAPARAVAQSHSSGTILLKLQIGIVGAIIGIVSICISICRFRRKISSNSIVFWSGKTKNDQNVEAFIRHCGSLAPKRYSYSNVKKITNSFKDKLGQGGFGNVFKGKLLDGHPVAVKVLNASKGNGEDFINEVASICRTSHVNVVTLLGFCLEGHIRALIYEFMPNGSLEKFIYNDNPLKTSRHLGREKLHQIAIGIAQGLEYLHRGCITRILHFDIKPHNILLDEEFCPKISDFGLAKLCPRKEIVVSMLEARGTIGYIAPEVFSRNFGGVSHKSDVYSYGMMVLEMVGGRKNIDVGGCTSEIYLPHWVYKRFQLDNDLRLQDVMSEEENIIVRKMILVGLWCIQTNPLHRPSMSEVLNMLEGSIEALQIPPKPFLSSPPRPPANSSTSSMS